MPAGIKKIRQDQNKLSPREGEDAPAIGTEDTSKNNALAGKLVQVGTGALRTQHCSALLSDSESEHSTINAAESLRQIRGKNAKISSTSPGNLNVQSGCSTKHYNPGHESRT